MIFHGQTFSLLTDILRFFIEKKWCFFKEINIQNLELHEHVQEAELLHIYVLLKIVLRSVASLKCSDRPKI